ncbi:carboxymuconolactone decarboxylase family protein [Rothia kristinae]|uniref:Carboxymuconolactone decarboxylase family protein n=1 Tax=Rothia kristinae TaxID=37923 RepID=A0A7T3CHK0_9MICC|nr:carboxymuconolactone decarboxylase family protein [Rothia kristinae]
MAMSEELTRRGDEVFERLFGAAPDPQAGDDPEFMAILRRVIFGQVFSVGELEDRTRELITVTILAAMQCPGQLTAHTRAALHVGATPEQIREAIYGLAPFLGFPPHPQRDRRDERGIPRRRRPAASRPAHHDAGGGALRTRHGPAAAAVRG